jgi:hypothetical protein
MGKFCLVVDMAAESGIEASATFIKLRLSVLTTLSVSCSGLQLPASPCIYLPTSPDP